MKKILWLTAFLLFFSTQVLAFPLVPGPNGFLIPDYFGNVPNYANSPLPDLTNCSPPAYCGMRKFVDPLPGLYISGVSPIPPVGKYIPVAVPDTTTYPGSDYYEIELGEYYQQMHSDLPATKLRGYRQTNASDPYVNVFSYLGPVIIAQRNKPVRVKFTNNLPTGAGGNLFIPVDTTYMGAGTGPNLGTEMYTQNRATIHLHGGTTPWISDGTLYQWATPATETTSYPKGVSVYNVPDMPNPGEPPIPPTPDPSAGVLTFFYSNQQSARLMFFHDHAVGITRLNVYAGEAGGYLLTDPSEQALFGPTGTFPDLGEGIPLIIQDKTFVPDNTRSFTNFWGTFPSQLAAQDPTWDTTKWGGFGQLWFPHVYMTNQNPYDVTGANAMGRWDYGPWFWPPFTGLLYGAVPNPYAGNPGEPPFIPGTPNPSGVPESFMDTPVINGTAYPTLTVDPKPYRFRILSVGNDRMFNLSLWVAADKTSPTTAGTTGAVLCTDNSIVPPANCTEVKMVPFNSVQNAASPFPSWWYTVVTNGFTFDDRAGGVPDPATRGPAMIQIATEGGFLPAPVVIKNQPVNYVYNRRDITVGNVKEKALFLGPAERADIIVDFTNFAGKTLLLYNDAPAPVPALDPRLDLYTGDPDQTDTGGPPSTLPGFGPNTRTIMQIVVNGSGGTAPVDDYDPAMLTALQTAFPAAFAASQDSIIVPQNAYDPVYGTTTTDTPGVNLVRIQDTSMQFTPLGQTKARLFDFFPKSIIEDFQVDYGRMNATLGVEIPHTNNTNQTSIIQNLVDPPTEVIKISDPSLTPIGTAADGTQIWKITHNGVDTHAIHFHMFNVQVVNRVGWDGAIRPPDPNELGFKDTVRMNPLEDIIVALRPIKLTNVPFKIPNSIRPLAPDAPLGATVGPSGGPLFNNVDPNGLPVTITNQLVNYGWEYVWHCHILGHEENDMMRPMALAPKPDTPTNLVSLPNWSTLRVQLSWKDNSANETSWTVKRSVNGGAYQNYATIASTTGPTFGNLVTYIDKGVIASTNYGYRVIASDTVGSSVPGYPQVTADSGLSNIAQVGGAGAPAAPTGLLATPSPLSQNPPTVTVTWIDNANNETGFLIQRALNGSFTIGLTSFKVGPSPGTGATKTFIDTTVAQHTTYYYRASAYNGNIYSPPSNSDPATTRGQLPATPAISTVGPFGAGALNVIWAYTSNGALGPIMFDVQRSNTGTGGWTFVADNILATSFLDTGLPAGTKRYYRVRAVNADGNSPWSSVASGTTLP